MQDAATISRMAAKYVALLDDLDERGRRRWAAVEARAIGWGGVTAVAAATGLSDRTIRQGIMELDDPAPLSSRRQRKVGAGRKSRDTTQPGLWKALEALIEPTTRGEPTTPLRWTIKSTYQLANAFREPGQAVSATSVRRMLVSLKYSLQGHRKTREGRQHPDRDGQFQSISQRVQARQRRREPAISVDTKKKEVLAASEVLKGLKQPGQTYRPQGDPLQVKTHDFPDP